MGASKMQKSKRVPQRRRRDAVGALKPQPVHLGTARPGYTMQVCSRCDGSAVDPEMPDCTCDVCGGTGEEEIPADYERGQ